MRPATLQSRKFTTTIGWEELRSKTPCGALESFSFWALDLSHSGPQWRPRLGTAPDPEGDFVQQYFGRLFAVIPDRVKFAQGFSILLARRFHAVRRGFVIQGCDPSEL